MTSQPRSAGMSTRRRVGKAVVRALGYRMVGEQPPAHEVCVIVAAPHTSWQDLPLMVGMAWASDMRPAFLAKQELFRAPFGAALRRLGGIPVDRDNPGRLVEGLIKRASAGEAFALVIAPEGSRYLRERWKSGFYRIADQAQVPLVLTYLDGPTGTGGFGPTLRTSGDLTADMDLIRQFYADKRGVHPGRSSPVRLGEEDGAGDAPASA